MPMTRTQALHVASSRNATRLGNLATGQPPNDLLDRQNAQGNPLQLPVSNSSTPGQLLPPPGLLENL